MEVHFSLESHFVADIITSQWIRVTILGAAEVGKSSMQEKFLSPENSEFYESVQGNE